MSTVLAERLTVPFDLILTASGGVRDLARPVTSYLRSFRVLQVDNRGRDILPFLRALAVADGAGIGLKLHTKKSPQRADGARWLAEVLDTLLPPADGAREIVARLRADPRIGMVAPQRFCLPVRPWVLVNGPPMARVMATLGHHLVDADLDDCYFAAGSMFWFRLSALGALADARVADLFEPEEGQLDGTIAHGMERLFPVEARRQGLLSIAMPALMSLGSQSSAKDLLDATRRHADEPNPLFPAPYESPASASFIAPEAPDASAGVASAHPLGWLGACYRLLPLSARRQVRRLLGRPV